MEHEIKLKQRILLKIYFILKVKPNICKVKNVLQHIKIHKIKSNWNLRVHQLDGTFSQLSLGVPNYTSVEYSSKVIYLNKEKRFYSYSKILSQVEGDVNNNV